MNFICEQTKIKSVQEFVRILLSELLLHVFNFVVVVAVVYLPVAENAIRSEI